MIRVQNLWHHYGVRPVLQDVCLQIETGELVVLLGPNGMGKTTLLGCLAGVLWPQRGHVEYDGLRRRESVDGERRIRQRVAYVPDDAWLPPLRTAREYLLGMGRLYGHDDFHIFAHAERLLRLFHLDQQGDNSMSSFSTGQRKKIALAGGLISEAPYLLLDEPFSGGLDPAGILAMKSVLAQLAQRDDVTIVITTPVPELVEELAHRVAVIRDGRLIHFDTPEGLRRAAGADITFDRALQQLTYPDTLDVVSAYLDGR
jgi:ABC-type multidrug transport system ATPase subunit